jgi:hypothetical protein
MKNRNYEALQVWLKKESREANRVQKLTDRFQKYVQGFIPDKIQEAITKGMEGFTRLVMTGSGIKLPKTDAHLSLDQRELLAQKEIENAVHLGMISGAGTSAGGIITSLMDLPILMSFKIKLIFEIGSHFGYDLKDPKERYFAMLIFREAFSNATLKKQHLQALIEFESRRETLENPLETIDWKGFQQEYRDYIDLAKLLQIIPGIGIVIGAGVNRQLLLHLGETAINAYRLRYFQKHPENRFDITKTPLGQ